MGKAMLVMVAIVLMVYAIYDLLATPKSKVRGMPKAAWLAVIVLMPYFGPAIWILVSLQSQGPSSPPQRPRGSRGPDDDPDFLRGL